MADEMDGVDLFNLHATIEKKLREQFPKFKLVEFYRSEEERKPPTLNELPALFLEMDFEINLDGDSGSEQLPLIARVEARVIDSFERQNSKINIRSLAAQVAYYIFKNKRFHAYNGSIAVGPASLDALTQDHFYPSLKSYEVWRVDFSIPILVGENIWKQIGETPIPVYSYTPDVGIGHEQDYQEVELLSYANANMDRMLGDLIRYGRIESVDFETMTAAVDFDGLLVTGLEWAKSRAGDDRSGNAPSEGEQVCVLSPSGDIAQGVIAFSITQEKFPNPNKNANPKTIYVDGTYIEYDKQSHTLTVDASQAGGEVIVKCSHVQIDAPETTCTGNLSVGGALAVKGKSTMSGNVSFTGGSVTHNGKNIGGSHTHNKVKSGGDNSGEVN